MSGKKKNLKLFPRYEENPSSGRHKIVGLSIGTRPVPIDKQIVRDDELVEEFTENGWRVRVWDSKQFVKLFPDGQADLVKLGSSGIAVFCYILLHLKKLQDQVTILPLAFGEWYRCLEGCSESNTKMICYRGIIDLLNNEFLYLKVGEGSYFININKFFNGDVRKVAWVAEIDDKLKNNVPVSKKAVEYDPEYKKRDNDI